MNNKLINRILASSLSNVFRVLPVITLTGPRQSGKTTLCRDLFPELPYVSLEDVTTLSELQSDPTAFFSRYQNGVIIGTKPLSYNNSVEFYFAPFLRLHSLQSI